MINPEIWGDPIFRPTQMMHFDQFNSPSKDYPSTLQGLSSHLWPFVYFLRLRWWAGLGVFLNAAKPHECLAFRVCVKVNGKDIPSPIKRFEDRISNPWLGMDRQTQCGHIYIYLDLDLDLSISSISLSTLSIYISIFLSFGSIMDPIKMTPSHGGMTMRPCAIPCNLTISVRKCGSLEGSLKDGPGVLGKGTMTQWP